MSKAFGELLNSYILRAGYSQLRLAKEIGMNRIHLNRAINGDRNLGKEITTSIADVLDIPFEERAKLHLLARGLSEEEVDRMLPNR